MTSSRKRLSLNTKSYLIVIIEDKDAINENTRGLFWKSNAQKDDQFNQEIKKEKGEYIIIIWYIDRNNTAYVRWTTKLLMKEVWFNAKIVKLGITVLALVYQQYLRRLLVRKFIRREEWQYDRTEPHAAKHRIPGVYNSELSMTERD